MPHTGPSKEIIVGEGLILKNLRQESAPVIFKSIDLNRQHLRNWLPFVDNTWKVEDTEIFIKSILEASGPKRDLVYEIWHHDEFAGLIALKEIDRWNKRSELGYWLLPHFEGKGIMTSCCKSLIDCAYHNMGLHRIQIKAGVGNSRSSRIPEKLGFKLEGIERSGEKFSDHYIDLEVFSMLREEWIHQ
jgi:ribosomal-protein-serine acetyltransferase